jgi:hypothetical protein
MKNQSPGSFCRDFFFWNYLCLKTFDKINM